VTLLRRARFRSTVITRWRQAVRPEPGRLFAAPEAIPGLTVPSGVEMTEMAP